jgi:hypothetical protein
MAGSGENLGMDSQIDRSLCCGLCQEPFSREQWLCPLLFTMARKVAIYEPREIHMILDHIRTEREKRVAYWSGFPLHDVHRFKSL